MENKKSNACVDEECYYTEESGATSIDTVDKLSPLLIKQNNKVKRKSRARQSLNYKPPPKNMVQKKKSSKRCSILESLERWNEIKRMATECNDRKGYKSKLPSYAVDRMITGSSICTADTSSMTPVQIPLCFLAQENELGSKWTRKSKYVRSCEINCVITTDKYAEEPMTTDLDATLDCLLEH